jgi:hypothetical protein
MDRLVAFDAIGPSGEVLRVGSPAHLSSTETDLEKVAADLTADGAMLAFIQNPPPGLPISCPSGTSTRSECQVRGSADTIIAQYDALVTRVVARHSSTMRVVPWTDLVCPNDHCWPRLDGVLIRHDQIHYTKAGAIWLSPYLYQRLKEVSVVPIVVTHTRLKFPGTNNGTG